MNTETTKICSICGKRKSIEEMDTVAKNGKVYHRSSCKKCRNRRCQIWKEKNPQRYFAGQQELMLERKRQRSCLEEQDKFIFWDSRNSDRKSGLQNDLTRDFIRELITKGCSYCGETRSRMTLDRIDNSIGHVQNNVVPCCIRCNYIRRDMPASAWGVISSSVREARERGLFGDWTGRVVKRH